MSVGIPLKIVAGDTQQFLGADLVSAMGMEPRPSGGTTLTLGNALMTALNLGGAGNIALTTVNIGTGATTSAQTINIGTNAFSPGSSIVLGNTTSTVQIPGALTVTTSETLVGATIIGTTPGTNADTLQVFAKSTLTSGRTGAADHGLAVLLNGVTNAAQNGIDVSISSATAAGDGISVTHSGLGTALVANAALTGNAFEAQDAGVAVFTVTGAGAITAAPTSGQNFTVDTLAAGGISLDSAAASNFTTTVGALTITSAAAATWGTAAGVLAVSGFTGVNLQLNAVTKLGISSAGAITATPTSGQTFEASALGVGGINLYTTATGAAGGTLSLLTSTSGAGSTAGAIQITAEQSVTVGTGGDVDISTAAVGASRIAGNVIIGSDSTVSNTPGQLRLYTQDPVTGPVGAGDITVHAGRSGSGTYFYNETVLALTIGSVGTSVLFSADASADFAERAGDPTTTANQGKLYTKDVSTVTQLFYKDSAGVVTQLSAAAAATLQSAYVAGNTISVTTGEGAVQISDSADLTNTLEVSRTFAGGGVGVAITMGAGGEAVTGTGLDAYSGTGATGDTAVFQNDGTGKAIQIFQNKSGVGLAVLKSTATSTGHGITVAGSAGTSGNLIDLTQNIGGVGLSIVGTGGGRGTMLFVNSSTGSNLLTDLQWNGGSMFSVNPAEIKVKMGSLAQDVAAEAYGTFAVIGLAVGSNPNQYAPISQFRATGLQTVSTSLSEVSPEGVITANPGSITHVRYPLADPNDGLWVKTTLTGNTGWSKAAVTTDIKLQTAYDNSSGTITTTAAKPVVITNAVDASSALKVNKTGAFAGNAIEITLGAGSTASAVSIVQEGTTATSNGYSVTTGAANQSNAAIVGVDTLTWVNPTITASIASGTFGVDDVGRTITITGSASNDGDFVITSFINGTSITWDNGESGGTETGITGTWAITAPTAAAGFLVNAPTATSVGPGLKVAYGGKGAGVLVETAATAPATANALSVVNAGAGVAVALTGTNLAGDRLLEIAQQSTSASGVNITLGGFNGSTGNGDSLAFTAGPNTVVLVSALATFTANDVGRTITITGANNQTGVGDSVTVGPTQTLTDAAGLFTALHVGQPITITGMSNGVNNGTFTIASFISATQITYANGAGVAETSAFIWSIALAGVNDGSFTITVYNSPTSVTWVNATGESVTTALTWTVVADSATGDAFISTVYMAGSTGRAADLVNFGSGETLAATSNGTGAAALLVAAGSGNALTVQRNGAIDVLTVSQYGVVTSLGGDNGTVGSAISLTAGAGVTGVGGAASLTAGAGGSAANGGVASVIAGAATAVTFAGGGVNITAGPGLTTGAGGTVTMTGGPTGVGGLPGYVQVTTTRTANNTAGTDGYGLGITQAGGTAGIWVGASDPSGSVTGTSGSIYLRTTGVAYINTGGTAWTQFAASGGTTMQSAYDSSTGAPVLVTQSATDGGIKFTRGLSTDVSVLTLEDANATSQNRPVLVVSKVPAATDSGNGISLTMNTNTTGTGIAVTMGTGATGAGISTTGGGSGRGISVTQLLNSAGGILVTQTGVTATPGIEVAMSAAATATGYGISITGGGALSSGAAQFITTGSSAVTPCVRVNATGAGTQTALDVDSDGAHAAVTITNSGSGETCIITASGGGNIFELRRVATPVLSVFAAGSVYVTPTSGQDFRVDTLAAGGISLDSAAASNFTTTVGALTITSGAAATWSTANGTGFDLTVQAGTGTGAGGALNLVSGAGVGTGISGGNIALTTGLGTAHTTGTAGSAGSWGFTGGVGGAVTTGIGGIGGGAAWTLGNGGAASGAGGAGGAGGAVNVTLGTGGAATTGVAGNSGNFTVNGSAGGNASGAAGTGGNASGFFFYGGAGGTSTTGPAGIGGQFQLLSGFGGAASSSGNGGMGGGMALQAAGGGDTATGTAGAGGNWTGYAGASGAVSGVTGTATVGGSINLVSGNGSGRTGATALVAGAGGVLNIYSGSGGGQSNASSTGNAGAGGKIEILPGNGGNLTNAGASGTAGAGGDLTLTAGYGGTKVTAGTAGAGGNLYVIGGERGGATAAYGGVSITAGLTAPVTPTAGGIHIQAGTTPVADLTFNARGGTAITLNESGQTALSGFTATSIVGALNELKVTAVAASQIVQTGFDTTTNLVTSGQLGYLTTTATRVEKGIATSLAASLVFGANEGTVNKMTTAGTIEAMKAEPGLATPIAVGNRLFLSAFAAGTVTNLAPVTVTQVVLPVGYARTAGTGGTLAGAMVITDSFSAGPTQTLSVAGAFVAGDVGRTIKITGATSAGNNGYFVITSVVAGTSATYTNAGAVAEAALVTTTYDISFVTDLLMQIGSPVVL